MCRWLDSAVATYGGSVSVTGVEALDCVPEDAVDFSRISFLDIFVGLKTIVRAFEEARRFCSYAAFRAPKFETARAAAAV